LIATFIVLDFVFQVLKSYSCFINFFLLFLTPMES